MELSRERLVLYSGAGLLGGLAGWAAADPLAAVGNVHLRAMALGGVTGICVGAFMGAIEGLSAGHKNKTWQGVKLGGLAGLVGGAVGLLMGELVFGLFGGLGGARYRLGNFRACRRAGSRLGRPIGGPFTQWRDWRLYRRGHRGGRSFRLSPPSCRRPLAVGSPWPSWER